MPLPRAGGARPAFTSRCASRFCGLTGAQGTECSVCGRKKQVGEGDFVEGCRGTESNRRHGDFQSPALPTELPRLSKRVVFYQNPGPLQDRPDQLWSRAIRAEKRGVGTQALQPAVSSRRLRRRQESRLYHSRVLFRGLHPRWVKRANRPGATIKSQRPQSTWRGLVPGRLPRWRPRGKFGSTNASTGIGPDRGGPTSI